MNCNPQNLTKCLGCQTTFLTTSGLTIHIRKCEPAQLLIKQGQEHKADANLSLHKQYQTKSLIFNSLLQLFDKIALHGNRAIRDNSKNAARQTRRLIMKLIDRNLKSTPTKKTYTKGLLTKTRAELLTLMKETQYGLPRPTNNNNNTNQELHISPDPDTPH